MRRFISYGPAFVVLLTTLVTLVAAPAAVRRLGYATTDTQIRLARASLDGDDILERLNAAVRNIAKTVEPSVVHIQWDTSKLAGRGRTLVAQGSGWVFDDAGHIVTNAHVVRGSPGLIVQFYDGRRVPAEIVGLDQQTDVAVIRVRTTDGLFPASRATGQEVSQGDRVYAFGSPFGFKFSMSEGIVSGLGRDPTTIIGESGGYTNYIQSDAAVNPGNSGGPLVDIKGRVVGMNVAIATAGSEGGGGPERGQSAGISFAIPLDTIESVVDQLINNHEVKKGYLGVTLPLPSPQFPDPEDYNRNLLQESGFRGQGVVVKELPPDGPAAVAGIEPGDVIVKIKGHAVSTVAGLRQAIAINRPGDQIDVQVSREGQIRDFRVKLGDLTQIQKMTQRVESALSGYGFDRWLPTDDGLRILTMLRPSQAYEDGFRPGQTIVSIEGQRVNSGDTLLAALTAKGFVNGTKLTAVVLDADVRGGRQRELTMQYKP